MSSGADNFDFSRGVRGTNAPAHYVAKFIGGPKDGQVLRLMRYNTVMYFSLDRYTLIKINTPNKGLIELEYKYEPLLNAPSKIRESIG
jgi:hypothetical protein